MSGLLRARFDSSPGQLWYLESPANVTANLAVDIQANDTTLNQANIDDLHINIWLLRMDFSSDSNASTHDPALLASDQLTIDFEIIWTPTIDDVDVGVPEAGIHQIAWENGDNNLALDPQNTSFIGVSKAFNVLPDNVGAAASSSASALEASASELLFPSDTAVATLPGSAVGTSSTKSSANSLPGSALGTTSNTKTAGISRTPSSTRLASSPTSTFTLPGTSISAGATTPLTSSPSKLGNNQIIIGLTVGLILLLLVGAAGAFWGLRLYRKRTTRQGLMGKEQKQVQKQEQPVAERPNVPEIGGKGLPVEMDSLQSRLHELGMADPIELPAGRIGPDWGGGQDIWLGR